MELLAECDIFNGLFTEVALGVTFFKQSVQSVFINSRSRLQFMILKLELKKTSDIRGVNLR